MTKRKIRILIADDHTVVRKGLKALLSDEKYAIEVVGEANNGEEAIRLTQLLKPDVILMDLIMPVVSGMEAIKQIKGVLPDARILVLTSFADNKNISEAIQSGAHGFLLKDTSPDELVQTITSVYNDRLILPHSLTHFLLQNDDRVNSRKPGVYELTLREMDVIKQIAQGLSNAQIAEELSISVTTVRTHISNMLHKLELENRTQLALFAQEHDLV